MLQDNLDPFLNNGIIFADFNQLRKIPFSKELLMIAKRGIEIWFLIFLKIDVGMLLGAVLLLEIKVYIMSDISSGVVGIMKNDSALTALLFIRRQLGSHDLTFDLL